MFRKIFSAALIVCFLWGGTAFAATSPVGFVDYGLLIEQHPDKPQADAAYKAELEAAKKEFESKSAGLSDKDKQELDRQLWQRAEQKRLELLKAVMDKINAAIKAVADAKGLAVVLDKTAVIYGGEDITMEVGKKISGK